MADVLSLCLLPWRQRIRSNWSLLYLGVFDGIPLPCNAHHLLHGLLLVSANAGSCFLTSLALHSRECYNMVAVGVFNLFTGNLQSTLCPGKC